MFKLSLFTAPLPQTSVLIGPAARWPALVVELTGQVNSTDLWQTKDLHQSLSMSEMPSIQQFAAQTPFAGQKLLLLPDPTVWSMETANALLKLLEEPPGYLTIVFFAQTTQFLPTIRSRSLPLFLSGRSATLEGRDTVAAEDWGNFFRQAAQKTAAERDFAKEAFYLQSLLHQGHRQKVVLEALQETKKYL